MTRLEHCLENAIVALEEGKDFDTWLYEERNKGNIHAWGNSDAVLTDASVIDVKDIWDLASYVQFVVVQNVKSAGYNKWLKENPYILGIDLDRSQKADRLEPEHHCCDICKTTHNNIGEMKTVIVRNSGPQDGEYHICKNCEPMLNGFLYELLNYDLLNGEVVINND